MKLGKRFPFKRINMVGVALGVLLVAYLAFPMTGTHAESSEAEDTISDAMAEYVEGEVLVKFKSRVSDKAVMGSLSAVGA